MPDPFTDEQRSNAAVIAQVGASLGASQRDILIAIMTAMQESGLRNINYGDRDSIGLFQQRDAWGSTAARLDPYQSAKMFFLGGNAGQRGLLDFADRDNLSLTQAAQAVQVSAFPDAYAKHEAAARTLLGAGTATGGTSIDAAAPGAPVDTPLVPPTVLPTIDNTVTQTTPMARTPDQTAPAVPGVTETITPGAAATVAPGAEATAAPGAQATATPGVVLPSAEPAPAGPEYADEVLDRDTFAQLFPDAAGTGMFTGMASGQLDGRRSDIITAAMSYVGVPYVWGGTSRAGVDCSGLISAVLGSFDVNVPRLSADQARAGQVVPLDQLQPGDLVAIDNSSRNNGADHIAIYAGNGEIIEAPRPGLAVRRRSIAGEDGWFGVKLSF